MKRLALWISSIVSVLLSGASRAEESKPVLFYLDQGRPIALEFQIEVDGKSIADMWVETLDRRFDAIDKNKDGEIAGVEQALLPNTRLLVLLNVAKSATHRPPPESLNRKAFGDYLEKLGFRPFKVEIEQTGAQNTREVLFVGGMQNNPNAAAEKLFAELDADADGKLSNAEMNRALTALARQDFDQDETISTAELVPTNYSQYFASPTFLSPSAPQAAFLSVTDRASYRAVATQLTAKYDTQEKDNALSQEEAGIDEEAFAKHDIDSNGKWDYEEIQQYLHSPKADVIVKIRLGKAAQADRPAIEFEHGKELQSEVKNAIGSLNLSSVQVEVSSGPEVANVESLLKSQFQSLDQDNNGYLDMTETERLGPAQTVLIQLDQDSDGKLFVEELLEGVLPVVQLVTQEIHLTVADRGRDLFRILDANADSRLSKRELWAMPNRAGMWDKDNDGQIRLTDVPQQFRLVAGPGNVNFLSGQANVVFTSVGSVYVPNAAPTTGPMWFRKMDRNADGDVSFKEFLGTLDEFQKLDRDRDGLISPQEAAI